jgi:hypothetical protein
MSPGWMPALAARCDLPWVRGGCGTWAVSSAGGPVVLAIVTAVSGVLLGRIWRSWEPVVAARDHH